MQPKLPRDASFVLQTINNKGQGYYIRDTVCCWCLGIEPKEYLLACSLTVKELLAMFGEFYPALGRENTVCFIYKDKTYRVYANECSVVKKLETRTWNIFSVLEASNFTVHALALNEDFLLDPFGAQDDIKNKRITTIHSPELWFNKHAKDILEIYKCCARYGFKADSKVLVYANKQAWRLGTAMTNQEIGEGIEEILLSDNPEIAALCMESNCLECVGITGLADVSLLTKIAPYRANRWWAFGVLSGISVNTLAKSFGFEENFTQELEEIHHLFKLGPASNKTVLKLNLFNTKLDARLLLEGFAVVENTFENDLYLLAEIEQNKEAYLVSQLTVSKELLQLEGIPKEKCSQILLDLLGIVVKKPEYNTTKQLLTLAQGLKLL